jgi:hypothetical protein
MTRPRTVLPAEELLHPYPLLAVIVLVVNDRLLKGSGVLPGWLTGKLSDVAGLFFFPLLLTALARLAAWPLLRRRPPLTRWLLAGAIALTAAGFAAVKLVPAAGRAFAAASAWLEPLDRFARVTVVQDPTDLLALPVLALTAWHGARFCRSPAAAPPPADPTQQAR